MKNQPQDSASAVLASRRKKSIWFKGCLAIALVVVMLTSYLLIFPARTVERELICGLTEHVHDEGCYAVALICGLEESAEHQHSEECYGAVLSCGLEEHVHSADCFAPLELPVTELPTEDTESTQTEPADTAEPGESDPADESSATEPGDSAPVTEPLPEEGSGEEEAPADTEPVVTDPAVTEPGMPTEGNNPRTGLSTSPLTQQGPAFEIPEEGIDLAPYLESVSFQRQEGGAYVEDDWFENGETAKAAIIYDIPKNVVFGENRYVYYQLPEGIRPIEETSGEVMDNGVAVGLYTITEDGVIHILFNEDFANGNAIMGTVEFSSYLYANDDGSDRVVEFENNAGRITIIMPDTQKYDLRMEKTGSFNNDYSGADYVLTISSERGSGNPIDLGDQLTIQTPATLFDASYVRDSLELWLVDAEGNQTRLYEPAPVWSEDGTSFRLDALPALEAGASYQVRYSVALDPDLSGSFELDNAADAKAGDLEADTSFFISYVCDITKTGTFNSATGLIDWVITVNPESRPVAGWRIEDILPYPAVGRVLLTNANGVRYADITPDDGRTIRYVFPPNAPARPYFIRYSTAAPTTKETVTNTVTLINEREITVSSEVSVDERSEGVNKELGAKHVRPDGMVQTQWSFQLTLPVGELDSYTFRDNISTPIMDVNTGEYLDPNLHFAYAAEMEEALRGNLRLVSDGNAYYYGDPENNYVHFELSYFDAGGNPVAPEDSETHVSRVVFTVTPLQGATFHGYEILADLYPTWLDAREAEEGDYWSYQNYLFLRGGLYDVVPAFYRKGNAFEKQVKDSEGKYSSDDATIDFADCGGILEYRLLIDLTAVVEDAVTVTDVLPAGVELLETSPRIFYTGANYYGEYQGSFSREGNFTTTVEPQEDGSAKVSFSGFGITEEMRQAYAYICIVYQVRLTDDSIWNDYSFGTETFSNVATWNEYTTTQSTTVVNEPKRLEKTGTQVLDEGGNPTGKVRFTVLINAGAEDLDPDSFWITLTDSFHSGIGSSLELGSVRLYHYDPTKPDCLGNQVKNYEYQMSYDLETDTMTLRLRDEMAYVLLYDYTVDFTAILDGQTSVSNDAELTGSFHSQTEVVLRGVSSSATAWQRVITITKVDADNHAKVLPGAEFSLEYWDPELGTWCRELNAEGQGLTYVTNEAGKIILTLIGTEKDLNTSTLYRLTETKAAPGYETGDTVIWFLCLPKISQSREEVYAEAAAGSGVEFTDIYFFSSTGGSAVITNRFNGLTVDKRWFTNDGVEIADPKQDPVRVTLYVSTDPSGESGRQAVEAGENLENPVLLSEENDWSYTWSGLPEYDPASGAQLYYFVEEDPLHGFTPSYTNNGITGGTIVISNTEVYELPSTGSIGEAGLLVLGGVLMLLSLSAALFLSLRKRRQNPS